MVFVLQRPRFQEDEGRFLYVGCFGSERQAEIYLESRIGEGHYDLKRSDFIITKQV